MKDIQLQNRSKKKTKKRHAVRTMVEIAVALVVVSLIIFNIRNILSISSGPRVIYAVPKNQEPAPVGAQQYKGVQFTTKLYDEKFTKTLGLVSYESYIYITRNSGEDFFGYIYDGSKNVEGYFKAGDIVPWNTKLYAEIPASAATGNLVDLRRVVPTAEYYIFMATEENFTKKRQYDRDLALLQNSTAQKLLKAQQKAEADGYRLKIYDCYRPRSVQYKLWEIVPNSKYVGDPRQGSNHNRGAAVDLTFTKDGVELDMPTGVDDYTDGLCERSQSGKWSEEQRNNVAYLTNLMESCGFTRLSTEWWHYDDTDKGLFPLSDLDFKTVKMSAAPIS